MSRNETAARFVDLLIKTPAGMHRSVIKRKLGITSDSMFYRHLAAARELTRSGIDCRNHVYLLPCPPTSTGTSPFVPTDDELISLVSLQKILASMTSGALNDILEPLRLRLVDYLGTVDKKSVEWPSRIKILDIHYRKINEGIFRALLRAASHRRVIRCTYSDSQGRQSDRTVSPQQLVRYKDNWYLDAWCHANNDLRIFSLDNIADIRAVNKPCVVASPEQLQRVYATSYGLFSGEPTEVAVVRFTGLAALYAKRESWHPQQKLTPDADGSVHLEIPFNKPQELIKEILSWGSDAEVLAPERLRDEIAETIEKMSERYRTLPSTKK